MKLVEQGQSEAGVGVSTPGSAMACTGLERRRGNTPGYKDQHQGAAWPAGSVHPGPSLTQHSLGRV